ncbi:hypothetical protein M427DRAFT_58369 [Gonapodya prolifera JEL478]|uniref:Uncharacterized protein n=1 Tax=Gonapodya prolifera (strain JEL478) TaxID=1344416 RepID=A0A139AAF4_GONPJ|nr:hypothetical protein M427DRAFT_58369 [Gonapodya prolifera JEL478]|eukprot:KXS13776.1 hypothetical protein M427DRAFT_58369 [Gonapodya prolifera JEL478]
MPPKIKPMHGVTRSIQRSTLYSTARRLTRAARETAFTTTVTVTLLGCIYILFHISEDGAARPEVVWVFGLSGLQKAQKQPFIVTRLQRNETSNHVSREQGPQVSGAAERCEIHMRLWGKMW